MNLNETLLQLRREYTLKGLSELDVDSNPFIQTERWLQQAIDAGLLLPNSMALATATKEGKPSVRIVLLKSMDASGFVFYTNYESRKAKELDHNAVASLLFHWVELERQIRIDGQVERTTRKEAEEYFQTRPYESRLAAWASHQSSVIPSREYLEQNYQRYKDRYPGDEVALPGHWGGYRLHPQTFEFWQGRENRLHDRLQYALQGDRWMIDRLSP